MNPNAPGFLYSLLPHGIWAGSITCLSQKMWQKWCCNRSSNMSKEGLGASAFVLLGGWGYYVRSLATLRRNHMKTPCGKSVGTGTGAEITWKRKASHTSIQLDPAFQASLLTHHTCEWSHSGYAKPSHRPTAATWETAGEINRRPTQLKPFN